MSTTSEALHLQAPVRRVTLLEDRAQVHRAGSVELPEGSHRLWVDALAPVVGDRSVVVRPVGEGARVDEAKVVRRWKIGATELPADHAALLQERTDLERTIVNRRVEANLLREQQHLADRALSLVVDGIDRELPHATGFESRWKDEFARFARTVRDAEEAVAKAEADLVELESKRTELALRAGPGQAGDAALETHLEIELSVRQAGRIFLEIDYMVPCALWRPIHRVTLQDGVTRFECEGAVWQATGEDWTDVELLFSTARPTQRSEPPRLEDDRLRAQRRHDKKVDVAIREETIATTGEGQAAVSSELPGVDDGGETRTLGAAKTASIPADGRLHRVPIFAWEDPAEIDRICRPEKSSLVHLRSKQSNTSPHVILAGPLELVRESGTVGRGEIGFVAPGERFVLGWGADDAVRVGRQVSESESETFLGRKRTRTRTVTLYLSNQEALPVRFRLEERIPVSEVTEVEIEVDAEKTKPPAKADDQGIVGWDLELPARGTRKVRLVYTLTAGKDVRGI